MDKVTDTAAAGTAGPVDALAPPRLAVIVPTFNEADNIARTVERILAATHGLTVEIVVVDDDSPDGTAEVVRGLAERDPRVRLLRRVGRRGLSGACVEGMIAARAPVVAVIDADLQHDEKLLPTLHEAVASGAADLAVGTRFASGADASAGLSGFREGASRAANGVTRLLLGVRLTDPMSGFFAVRRATVEELAPRLSPHGFKILADIAASARGRLAVAEFPYVFRERTAGASKLDARVGLEFLALLVSKLSGGLLSVRFVMFGGVGASGLLVHGATLWLAIAAGVYFALAQTLATVVAMTWNFFLNNWLTFRDRQLRGPLPVVRGLLSFYAVCGLGAVANVGVAEAIYRLDQTWWLAGLAGAIVGAVWNYAASGVVTWRAR